MAYCPIHGVLPSTWDGCELCQRRAEEQDEAAEERAELTARLSAEHTYRVNNPGEYECPYCKLTSLKRGARRCPRCQHDIEGDYWEAIDARRRREEEELDRKRRAHDEWLRSSPGILA